MNPTDKINILFHFQKDKEDYLSEGIKNLQTTFMGDYPKNKNIVLIGAPHTNLNEQNISPDTFNVIVVKPHEFENIQNNQLFIKLKNNLNPLVQPIIVIDKTPPGIYTAEPPKPIAKDSNQYVDAKNQLQSQGCKVVECDFSNMMPTSTAPIFGTVIKAVEKMQENQQELNKINSEFKTQMEDFIAGLKEKTKAHKNSANLQSKIENIENKYKEFQNTSKTPHDILKFTKEVKKIAADPALEEGNDKFSKWINNVIKFFYDKGIVKTDEVKLYKDVGLKAKTKEVKSFVQKIEQERQQTHQLKGRKI